MKLHFGMVALCLVAVCGCQPAHVQELSKKMWTPEFAVIPEFEEVWSWQDPEANRKSGMSHMYFVREVGELEIESQQTGAPLNYSSGGTLAALLKDPGFQKRLKTFENLQLPPQYATPEREESRKKYVAEWRNLENLFKTNGKAADIKNSLERLNLYALQIRYIPGQTQPTGDAAKKYSGVTPYEDPYKKPVP